MGVGVSLVIVVYKTAFPRISTLGRLPETEIYRWGIIDGGGVVND